MIQDLTGKGRKGKAANNGAKEFLSFEGSKSQWVGIKEVILGFVW